MQHVSALDLRQSLGKVLSKLKKAGRPILLTKDRKPAAVLISLEDYRRRFVDIEADVLRLAMVDKIANANLNVPEGSTLEMFQELRGSR